MTHKEATKRFYAHVWPLRAMLLRTATFLAQSATDAEDLVQETLMKAFRAIDTFDVTTNAQPWLTAILRNTRIDRARAAGRTPGGRDAVSLDQAELDVPALPSADLDAPTIAATLESFSDQIIISALKRLPEEIRWTLMLVDVQQLDYQQAAKILEIPPGTVKSRLHRGRLMLKDDVLKSAPREKIGRGVS